MQLEGLQGGVVQKGFCGLGSWAVHRHGVPRGTHNYQPHSAHKFNGSQWHNGGSHYSWLGWKRSHVDDICDLPAAIGFLEFAYFSLLFNDRQENAHNFLLQAHKCRWSRDVVCELPAAIGFHPDVETVPLLYKRSHLSSVNSSQISLITWCCLWASGGDRPPSGCCICLTPL